MDLQKVRGETEKMVRSGRDVLTAGRLPQTPRAKRVIEYAIVEAREMGHDYVGTEHLLLGLMRVEDGVAGVVLRNQRLQLEVVREEVLNMVAAGLGERPAEERVVAKVREEVGAGFWKVYAIIVTLIAMGSLLVNIYRVWK